MAKNITNYVRSCVDDFKHFVGIDSFPAFDVKSKEITIEKSLKQGFDATAAVFYDRRSICKMYAIDYVANEDMSVIAGFIGEDTVKALDAFMLGWLDTTRVALIDALYGKMIVALAQRNKLA